MKVEDHFFAAGYKHATCWIYGSLRGMCYVFTSLKLPLEEVQFLALPYWLHFWLLEVATWDFWPLWCFPLSAACVRSKATLLFPVINIYRAHIQKLTSSNKNVTVSKNGLILLLLTRHTHAFTGVNSSDVEQTGGWQVCEWWSSAALAVPGMKPSLH